MSFGSSSAPPLPEPTKLPTDPSIMKDSLAAAERERRAMLLRRGRSSTILGGKETLGDPFTRKATLLGG